ncbi:hypothetical protein CEXT_392031 [Caerostris extrusa]|uniref:Uncharacterized protein n=1 Tax=Caerostris extrusa TaxID=172846 RepID=A0AAV4TNZ3_CAEEX|nr:hypothetical protein CEXT_392031 [Caerostris extrusa]
MVEVFFLFPNGSKYHHKVNTASNFTSELIAIKEAVALYLNDSNISGLTDGNEKSLKIVSKKLPENVYDIESLKNVPGAALESFKTVKYIGSNNWKLSTTNNPLPPTFNAWKEEELNKQVESEKRDKIPVPKTSKEN